jgi:hypothetical protein
MLEFDLSNYALQVNALEPYKNQIGTLALEHLTIDTNGYTEDYLVFSGVLDNGQVMEQTECERLFKLNAVVTHHNINQENLGELQEKNRQLALDKYESFKAQNFDDEYGKIEYFRTDVLEDFEAQLNELDEHIKEINKQIKHAARVSDKVQLTGQINQLKNKKRTLHEVRQNRELELDNELEELAKQYQQQLEPKITYNNLFFVNFRVV